MSLLELVKDGFLGVAPHARNPHLVDCPTRPSPDPRRGTDILGPSCFKHHARILGHGLYQSEFVLSIGHLNLKHGDSIHVNLIRVYANIILPSGQTLSVAGQAKRSYGFQKGLLVGLTESRGPPVEPDTTPALESETPQIALRPRPIVDVSKANYVNPVGTMRAIQACFSGQERKFPGGCVALNMVHQVMAQNSAGVSKPVRKLPVGRVEQDAHRLKRLRAQDYDSSVYFPGLSRVSINVQDSLGSSSVHVYQHLVDHGVRDVGAVARLECVRHSGESRIEVGVAHTAAFAGSAIVASHSAIDRFRDVSRAPKRYSPTQLLFHPVAK